MAYQQALKLQEAGEAIDSPESWERSRRVKAKPEAMQSME